MKNTPPNPFSKEKATRSLKGMRNGVRTINNNDIPSIDNGISHEMDDTNDLDDTKGKVRAFPSGIANNE
jgi:hypothetical protein